MPASCKHAQKLRRTRRSEHRWKRATRWGSMARQRCSSTVEW